MRSVPECAALNPVLITLPWPPSMNTYWRAFNGRNILSAKGRQYKESAYARVLLAGCPKFTGPCCVSIRLFPPDERRRDADNTLKPVIDCLVANGVIDGDDYRIVRRIEVEWAEKDKADPRAEVVVKLNGGGQ